MTYTCANCGEKMCGAYSHMTPDNLENREPFFTCQKKDEPMKSIDIAKVKTTRGGYLYRHYATTNDEHHGSCFIHGRWSFLVSQLDGQFMENAESKYDLVEEKTWRAWKDGEGPKRLMIRWKNYAADTYDMITRPGSGYSDQYLFDEATWLREDGTEKPCGICE